MNHFFAIMRIKHLHICAPCRIRMKYVSLWSLLSESTSEEYRLLLVYIPLLDFGFASKCLRLIWWIFKDRNVFQYITDNNSSCLFNLIKKNGFNFVILEEYSISYIYIFYQFRPIIRNLINWRVNSCFIYFLTIPGMLQVLWWKYSF